jgi:hypothetical protein
MTASLDLIQRDISVVNLNNSILASIDLSKSGVDVRDSQSPLLIAKTPRPNEGDAPVKLPTFRSLMPNLDHLVL